MIGGEQDVGVNMGATILVAIDLTQVGLTSRLIVKELMRTCCLLSEISIVTVSLLPRLCSAPILCSIAFDYIVPFHYQCEPVWFNK